MFKDWNVLQSKETLKLMVTLIFYFNQKHPNWMWTYCNPRTHACTLTLTHQLFPVLSYPSSALRICALAMLRMSSFFFKEVNMKTILANDISAVVETNISQLSPPAQLNNFEKLSWTRSVLSHRVPVVSSWSYHNHRQPGGAKEAKMS